MEALKAIRDRGIRMRLMLMVLTLGKDAKDPVTCRSITLIKNLADDTSVRIETDKISFTISIRQTINGRRTFLSSISADDEEYVRVLLKRVISTARTAGELPPVAEGASSRIINEFEKLGGTRTIGSDGKDAIILPISMNT